MPDVSDALHSQGWSQGDFLEGAVAVDVVTATIDHPPDLFAPGSILVLLSQDCDIVGASTIEPFLEFLVGSPVAEVNPLCQNGRNPRVLHLRIGERSFNFSIHNSVRVVKSALVTVQRDPSSRLPTADLDQLRRWVSRRFLRPAFPDAFNTRVDGNKKGVEKWEKKQAGLVSIVLFSLDTKAELPAGTDYGLTIILGYKTLPDPKDTAKTESELEAALAMRGIRIDDIVSRPETDITLMHLRTYKRWDRDYRSLPDHPETVGPSPHFDTV
jgi:hypothetical protein